MPSARRRPARARRRAARVNPWAPFADLRTRLPDLRSRLPTLRKPDLSAATLRTKIAVGVGLVGLATALVVFLTKKGGPIRLGGPPPEPPTRARLSSSQMPTKSWTGLLGVYRASGPNFNRLADGRNNFRAGVKDKYTTPTEEFFRELKRDYGIERVVSLSGSEPAKDTPALARAAGLEGYYFPMGEKSLGPRSAYEQVRALLRKGNTLVHCTHGADRTGAIIGRYYVDEGIMSVDEALADMDKYNGKPYAYESVIDFIKYGPQD